MLLKYTSFATTPAEGWHAAVVKNSKGNPSHEASFTRRPPLSPAGYAEEESLLVPPGSVITISSLTPDPGLEAGHRILDSPSKAKIIRFWGGGQARKGRSSTLKGGRPHASSGVKIPA
ncbi:hypothetical protein Tco_0306644 [Tanacetum coccineum]